MTTASTHLSPAARIIAGLINLIVGTLPSLAFFAWVERNASLPWVSLVLGWPWLAMQSWPVPVLVAWDFGLFIIFGFIHSLTAQSFFQNSLKRGLPIQTLRTTYMALTGLTLLGVMGLWQNTGVVLWTLPMPPFILNALSAVLFWGFMAISLSTVFRFDFLSFIGLKQLYSSSAELGRPEGLPKLETSGLYQWVRHPIYTFTTLAFVMTPFMTLDRAVLCGAMALYLLFAIPIEERKLIALFGPDYEEFRRRVPAVVPRLSKVWLINRRS